MIAERLRDTDDARRRLARLSARFHHAVPSAVPSDRVEVVRDNEAFDRAFADAQRSARLLRIFVAPPMLAPRTGDPLEGEMLRRGVRYRGLYAYATLAVPGFLALINEGLQGANSPGSPTCR